jgi:hypothetical protein
MYLTDQQIKLIADYADFYNGASVIIDFYPDTPLASFFGSNLEGYATIDEIHNQGVKIEGYAELIPFEWVILTAYELKHDYDDSDLFYLTSVLRYAEQQED